jgi:hypothetical protein
LTSSCKWLLHEPQRDVDELALRAFSEIISVGHRWRRAGDVRFCGIFREILFLRNRPKGVALTLGSLFGEGASALVCPPSPLGRPPVDALIGKGAVRRQTESVSERNGISGILRKADFVNRIKPYRVRERVCSTSALLLGATFASFLP